MLRLLGNIPRSIYVAVSGGVDSMAAIDFLRRKHDVTALYINHGTAYSNEAFKVVGNYCFAHSIVFLYHELPKDQKPTGLSWEEYWREERYKFFDKYENSGHPVVTAHHLDDAVETYLWRSMHGRGDVMAYQRKNVIRPFLLNRKQVFYDWAQRHEVPFLEDPSNQDTKYTRNLIRHDLMPIALKVNPGLYKTVQKKVEQRFMLDTLAK